MGAIVRFMLLCSINHWGIVASYTGQDGELAARSSICDLLGLDGSVDDLSRCLNIFFFALTRLIIGRETPRVDLALICDGEAVVGASSD